ncbi:helix-turn-helix domain-containing protein [Microbacterium sp. NPDC096154]|uniref:helix-turn-helix domain-containing protein n=1 Tax=Microbacterium sp. NPDC096154 TaxID=3155549 RepID=UPI00332360D5
MSSRSCWRQQYEAGATIAQLEERHGLSHGAVSRALKNLGVQMRPKGRPRKS